MSRVWAAYGGALYELAREEGLSERLMQELEALDRAIRQEPDLLKLLSCEGLTKEQRIGIIDDSFQKLFHPYVVRFLKLLTRQGYIRQLAGCCGYYRQCYERDHDILPATVVTAVALTPEQQRKLTAALAKVTGRRVVLTCRVEPQCLGGVRLDFAGQRLDNTLRNRLETMQRLLKSTAV